MNIIINNYISNYKQLKNFIESDNQKSNNKLLKQALEHTEAKILQENILKVNPVLYSTKDYENIPIDKKSIIITESNNGKILLYKNPTILETPKSRQLNNFTIREIKFMLAHLNSHLTNEFIGLNTNFRQNDIKKLIATLNFFESQVIRQYTDIKEIYNITTPIDAFKFNQKEKEEIVESQLKEIVEYLIDSGNKYIWGTLSDRQKQMIIKSITSNQKHDFIKRNMIDLVSNYTTLSELNKGVIKQRTLDRFIIK